MILMKIPRLILVECGGFRWAVARRSVTNVTEHGGEEQVKNSWMILTSFPVVVDSSSFWLVIGVLAFRPVHTSVQVDGK